MNTGPTTEFIAIVPARRASTRLPDKPLLDLGGEPMVVRTAKRAQQSSAQRVIVATDDDEIVACCVRFGIEPMLTRGDHVSGTDRIAEVVARLNLDAQAIVVNVQGDEPLIDPSLVDAVASALAAASDCAMATACHPLSQAEDFLNPHIVKVVRDAHGRALYFSRAPIPWPRQTSEDLHQSSSAPLGAQRHIGLYAYRASFLMRFPALAPAPLEHIERLEQLRALWHGERIMVLETARAAAPGVDTPEDLERVRALYMQTTIDRPKVVG